VPWPHQDSNTNSESPFESDVEQVLAVWNIKAGVGVQIDTQSVGAGAARGIGTHGQDLVVWTQSLPK
jgi:hypothetical protein